MTSVFFFIKIAVFVFILFFMSESKYLARLYDAAVFELIMDESDYFVHVIL
jgi:hypothetical protein